MSTFRCGHASDDDWEIAARACLSQIDPGTARVNLGFLYLSHAFARDARRILDFFTVRTGVTQWVGSVGLGVCGPGTEYFDQPAISVLVGRFPPDAFRVFGSVTDGFDTFEKSHGRWIEAVRPYFGVVHGDPRNPETGRLVSNLSARMEAGFLVGGLTSSSGEHYQLANGVTEGGLSGVLFSRDVAVSTRLTQGCVPIGPRHEITAGQENLVFELDGRPALDVLNEEVGEVLRRNPARLAGYIFAGLPVRGSDRGDYVVRNLLGIDPQHGLVAIGERVSEGDPLMFCRRDPPSAEHDLRRMVGDIRRSLGKAPRGGIYVSCVARGPNLFGPGSGELQIISEAIGPDLPLAGFFANGEISHDRMYAYTGVLTLFG